MAGGGGKPVSIPLSVHLQMGIQFDLPVSSALACSAMLPCNSYYWDPLNEKFDYDAMQSRDTSR